MLTDARKELLELLPASVLGSCVEVKASKGVCLFTAGQKPKLMYFVAGGEVVLERPGLQGSPVILQRTRRGFVSEASLRSSRYHCHGQVVADSLIIQVPIDEMRKALDSDPAFAGRWINMLDKEVKRLRLQCERLALITVRDRLTHLLETEGQAGKFPIGAGLKSIAGGLGVTHEALYRCVAAMEANGTITRTHGSLCLAAGPTVIG